MCVRCCHPPSDRPGGAAKAFPQGDAPFHAGSLGRIDVQQLNCNAANICAEGTRCVDPHPEVSCGWPNLGKSGVPFWKLAQATELVPLPEVGDTPMHHLLAGCLSVEQHFEDRQFKQDTADGPDIDSLTKITIAQQQLDGFVLRSAIVQTAGPDIIEALHPPMPGQVDDSTAEVDEAQHPAIDNHVAWLEVSVDNILRVHIMHAAKQLTDQAAEPARHRPFLILRTLLPDEMGQIVAAVLRNEAGHLVDGRYIHHLDNVGVAQLEQHIHFLENFLPDRIVVRFNYYRGATPFAFRAFRAHLPSFGMCPAVKRRGASEWCILGTCRIVKLIPAEQLHCLLEQPRRPLAMLRRYTPCTCSCIAVNDRDNRFLQVHRCQAGPLGRLGAGFFSRCRGGNGNGRYTRLASRYRGGSGNGRYTRCAIRCNRGIRQAWILRPEIQAPHDICFMLASSSNALTAMIADP